MNIFEYATRNKLRFQTTSGNLTVEDLWDLPLTSKTKVNLNSIGLEIRSNLKSQTEDSLVEPVNTSVANDLQIRFDIIMHIIKSKQEAAAKRRYEAEQASKIRILEQAIAYKKEEDIKNKSVDELMAELAAARAAISGETPSE